MKMTAEPFGQLVQERIVTYLNLRVDRTPMSPIEKGYRSNLRKAE